MRRKTITAFAIATLVTLLCTPVNGPAAPLQQGTIERSFDADSGGTLEVSASFGSIDVTTAADNRVQVRVEREVRDRYEADAEQILAEHRVEISQLGDSVRVTSETDDEARDRWRADYDGTPLRVRFVVSVPRSYNVELETSGGNIEVADLNGEIRAQTAGGNLAFGNIDGTVWAHTAGGNIDLRGTTGDAEVHTSGGHIDIGDVAGRIDAETSGGSITVARAGGDVRAETAGGSIDIEEVTGTVDARTSGGNVAATITAQPSGDCRLETSAGTVTVTLAAGIGLDVDADTSVGRVSSDIPIDGRVSRTSARGTVNGGGPELRLRTSAGSIRIRQR